MWIIICNSKEYSAIHESIHAPKRCRSHVIEKVHTHSAHAHKLSWLLELHKHRLYTDLYYLWAAILSSARWRWPGERGVEGDDEIERRKAMMERTNSTSVRVRVLVYNGMPYAKSTLSHCAQIVEFICFRMEWKFHWPNVAKCMQTCPPSPTHSHRERAVHTHRHTPIRFV